MTGRYTVWLAQNLAPSWVSNTAVCQHQYMSEGCVRWRRSRAGLVLCSLPAGHPSGVAVTPMRNLRVRDMELFAQTTHPVSDRTWDSNPGSLTPQARLLPATPSFFPTAWGEVNQLQGPCHGATSWGQALEEAVLIAQPGRVPPCVLLLEFTACLLQIRP